MELQKNNNSKYPSYFRECRCGKCEKLLARVGNYTSIQIKCPRCGTLNHLKTESLPSLPLSNPDQAEKEPESNRERRTLMSLSSEEINGLKAIVSNIWNTGIANRIDYNEEVAKVIRTAVEEISRCSAALKNMFELLADTALGALFSLPWLLAKGISIAGTLANAKNNLQHRLCINSVAANYRTRLEEASFGI